MIKQLDNQKQTPPPDKLWSSILNGNSSDVSSQSINNLNQNNKHKGDILFSCLQYAELLIQFISLRKYIPQQNYDISILFIFQKLWTVFFYIFMTFYNVIAALDFKLDSWPLA